MDPTNTGQLYFEQLTGLERVPPLFDYESMRLVDGVRLDIYFLGSHTKPSDLGAPGQFKSVLKSADIFLPETAGWTQNDVTTYNKIARGDHKTYLSTRESIRAGKWGSHEEFVEAMVSALYATRTTVAFVDMPSYHPLLHELERVSEEQSRMPAADLSFEEFIEYSRQWDFRFNLGQAGRDNHILTTFGQTVEGVIQANPKLSARREKNGVSVVMLLGGNHVGIHDAFEYKRDQLVTENPDLQFECTAHYGFRDRRITFGEQTFGRYVRGLEVDDLLMAKFILTDELYIIESARYPDASTDDIVQRIMPSLDLLSFEELKDLWDELHAER